MDPSCHLSLPCCCPFDVFSPVEHTHLCKRGLTGTYTHRLASPAPPSPPTGRDATAGVAAKRSCPFLGCQSPAAASWLCTSHCSSHNAHLQHADARYGYPHIYVYLQQLADPQDALPGPSTKHMSSIMCQLSYIVLAVVQSLGVPARSAAHSTRAHRWHHGRQAGRSRGKASASLCCHCTRHLAGLARTG